MPIQRVRIGQKIISSRELDWETIRKLSEFLRKLAKWDPEQKVWIFNWKTFANWSVLGELIREADKVDSNYAQQLRKFKNEIESLDRVVLINNLVYVLPLGINPYKLADKYDSMDVKIELKSLSFGNVRIPYLAIRGKMSGLEELPSELSRLIESKLKKRENRIIVVKTLSPRKILVKMPSNAPTGLILELKELGTIRFYYEDIEGTTTLRENILYKERIDKYEISIALPTYAFSYVMELARKYNFDVETELQLKNSLEYQINKSFELYPHQKEAFERWDITRKGTIVIPTGGGKTHIALEAIANLKVPTIIFVPNTLLLDQWVNKIFKFLGIPKGMIGKLGKGEKKLRDITVSTYQSAYRNIELIWNKFYMAIFDEAHHIPAQTFKNVALYLPAPYRLALSATPKRRDKNEILLFKLVGPPVYKVSYRDLVIRGIVAPVVVRKIFVPLPRDRVMEYYELERAMWRVSNPIEKKQLINRLISLSRDNEYKLDVIEQIVLARKDEKMFIFAGSIEFAEKIEKRLKQIIPTAALTSKTDSTKEKRIQEAFRSGKIKALILVKKGEEGVDVGDASIAIIAGGTKQEREFIQRVGRVLRGGDKKLAWVFEIVTEKTVEESISKKRQARKLVDGLEEIIFSRYNIPAYKEFTWRPGIKIPKKFVSLEAL